jgi:hypothetical protein
MSARVVRLKTKKSLMFSEAASVGVSSTAQDEEEEDEDDDDAAAAAAAA